MCAKLRQNSITCVECGMYSVEQVDDDDIMITFKCYTCGKKFKRFK